MICYALCVTATESANHTTDFYYSGGTKFFLERDTTKLCIGTIKSSSSKMQALSSYDEEIFINDDNYQLKVVSKQDNPSLRVSANKVDNGLMVFPCYKSKHGTLISLTPYIHVKLNSEEDEFILKETADIFNLNVLRKHKYLPKWYILNITDKTVGTPLR